MVRGDSEIYVILVLQAHTISQRDPLFTDFVTSLPRQTGYSGSMYNRWQH